MKKMKEVLSIDTESALLKKKIKKIDLKYEILKNAGKCILGRKDVIFHFMQKNENKYSIRLMAEVLNVNRIQYHKWKKKPLTDAQQRKMLIKKEITIIFYSAKQRYGSERIAVELTKRGYQLCSRTVRKYMSELELSALGKKE